MRHRPAVDLLEYLPHLSRRAGRAASEWRGGARRASSVTCEAVSKRGGGTISLSFPPARTFELPTIPLYESTRTNLEEEDDVEEEPKYFREHHVTSSIACKHHHCRDASR